MKFKNVDKPNIQRAQDAIELADKDGMDIELEFLDDCGDTLQDVKDYLENNGYELEIEVTEGPKDYSYLYKPGTKKYEKAKQDYQTNVEKHFKYYYGNIIPRNKYYDEDGKDMHSENDGWPY